MIARRGLFLAAIPVVLTLGYFAISAVLYQQFAEVTPHCGGRFPANTPSTFTLDPYNTTLDVQPYWMPTYQTVTIPSQPSGVNVSAWYVPAAQADAPVVIVIHGLNDCKAQPRSLLPAGMLHRAGYSTLLIDLREHGDSTVTDGLWAGGTEEYHDVLAAWDWLVSTQHITPAQIGLFAYSGGISSALYAMQVEPRIAAAWLDSPFADLQTAVDDQVYARGIPLIFVPGGMLIARLHGDDLYSMSPLAAVTHLGQRPIFITHGTADQTLKVDYSHQLADAIRTSGGNVELWITDGTQHVRSMFDMTDEYEQQLIAFFNAHLR